MTSAPASSAPASALRFTDVVKENLQQTVQQAAEHLPRSLPEPLKLDGLHLEMFKADTLSENLSDNLSPLTEQVKRGMAGGVHRANDLNGALTSKANDLNGALADRAQAVLSDPLQQWLLMHPFWSWVLQHPLFALVLALVGLILLFNALKLLLSPKTWIWLLGLPVRLMAKGLSPKAPSSLPADGNSGKNSRTPPTQPTTQSSAGLTAATSNNLSVPQILERLDALHQEQTELHQQLKVLLAQQADPR